MGQVSDCSSSSRLTHTGQSGHGRSQDAREGSQFAVLRVVAKDTSLQTVRFAKLFVTVAVKWAICPRCVVATAGGAPETSKAALLSLLVWEQYNLITIKKMMTCHVLSIPLGLGR